MLQAFHQNKNKAMSGYMIEIEHEKKAEMSECCEKILRYGGKLMQCIEDMGEEEGGSMGNRMGYRQGVRGTGRYGMRGGIGMREEPDMDYREPRSGYMGYRDPYYN